MKVGILTFSRTMNYGAALQSYALQSKIIAMGHECEIIDYQCSRLLSAHDPKKACRKKGIKAVFTPLIYLSLKRRKKKFEDFEDKYCRFSKACDRNDIVSLAQKYDRIIIGSDQVWNPDITGNDDTFFLDLINESEKKCTYAASVGKKYFSDDESAKYEALISAFRNISIREKGTARLLSDRIDRDDITNDIDPTLLDMSIWKRFVKKPPVPYDYIFMYFIPDDKKLMEAIKEFAKKKNCKLIIFHKNLKYTISYGIKTVVDASPSDFVNYIANARYVIAGSFHALCFSLIFQKEIYVTSSITLKDRITRLTDFLSLLSMEDRMISAPEYRFTDSKINYSYCKEVIDDTRNRSLINLKKIFE